MMFGIGKECSRLVSPILFENLIGGDSHSYGLSHKGILYHNGIMSKYCQPFKEQQPVIVGLSFDGPRKELSYFVDGKFMGIAFENLNLDDTVYYPMISRFVLSELISV
jgi:SPRY domain-containing SOCS box protein 3